MASDLGLHCLPKSLLWDARLKRVKCQLCHQNVTNFAKNVHLVRHWKESSAMQFIEV